MNSTTLTASHIGWRSVVALLGGYVFTWGVIVFGVTALYGLGMPFHDAEHLAYIVGILVYLVALLAGFAARALGRIAWVLVGGGLLLSGAGWLLQRQLV